MGGAREGRDPSPQGFCETHSVMLLLAAIEFSANDVVWDLADLKRQG